MLKVALVSSYYTCKGSSGSQRGVEWRGAGEGGDLDLVLGARCFMAAVRKTNGSIFHVVVPTVLFDKTPVLCDQGENELTVPKVS